MQGELGGISLFGVITDDFIVSDMSSVTAPVGKPVSQRRNGTKRRTWRQNRSLIQKNRSPLLRSPTGDLKTATGLLFTPK